jgi:hypothetical protein
MSYTELSQKVLRITGSVVDDHGYAAVVVNLTGVVTTATTVTSTGQFTVQVAASHLGLVMAEATDPGQQLASEPYALEVTSPPPVVSGFTGAENPNGSWTFQGHVASAVPQGDTVTFAGLSALQGKTAKVDGTGRFTVTVPVAASDEGTATAQVTDQWGQTSNLGEWIVRPTAPATASPSASTTPPSGSPTMMTSASSASLSATTPSGSSTTPAPAAPVIAYMSYTQLPQKVLCITGSVMDPQGYANVVVNLTGVATVATTVTSTGQFTVQVAASHLGLVMGEATDTGQQLTSDPYALEITSPPPEVSGFAGVENADGSWTFSGQVAGGVPQGDTVAFGGLSALQGKTAKVDGTGRFTLTVPVAASDEGTATAQVTDQWGQTSNLGEWIVRPTDTSAPPSGSPLPTASAGPVIDTFAAVQNANGTWTFSGHVTDTASSGDTVTLGGLSVLQGQSVAVDTNGNFIFTAALPAGARGTVTAQAADSAGLTSRVDQLALQPPPSEPPVIDTFTAVQNANGTWTFSGHVTDTASSGDTVTLGGLAALQGDSVAVDAGGNFTCTVALPAGLQGTVTAQATDSAKLTSNQALLAFTAA